MGDYNQHLLKMRLQGGLEGVELGPILGRGSYGRVYKGATAVLRPTQACMTSALTSAFGYIWVQPH